MADGQITLLLQSDWSVFGRLAGKKRARSPAHSAVLS